MPDNNDTRFECAPNYSWRKLEDKVVILDTTSGDFFMLNETAGLIWEGIMAQEDRPALIRRVTTQYDVSEEDCDRDVETLIAQFISDGFLSSPA